VILVVGLRRVVTFDRLLQLSKYQRAYVYEFIPNEFHSTLKMGAALSTETLVSYPKSTGCQHSEDLYLNEYELYLLFLLK